MLPCIGLSFWERIYISLVFKYFSVNKYVMKERAKAISDIKRSPHSG